MSVRKNDIFWELSKAMSRTQLKFKSFLRAKFREHNVDITFEMLQILIRLWEKDQLNQQELANLTFKDKASLTYLIDNMSKRKLVERREDQNDRRNKLISLMPEGQRLKSLIMPWIDEMATISVNGLSADQLRSGVEIFNRMHGNLEKVTE